MLRQGRHLQQPLGLVLLSKGDDALWDAMLQLRRGVRRRQPRPLRLSGGIHPVRESSQSDVLSRWPGVRLGMPDGGVAGDGGRMCQLHDDDLCSRRGHLQLVGAVLRQLLHQQRILRLPRRRGNVWCRERLLL
jgi:hypothetical protein